MFRIIPRAEWGARHDDGAGDRPLPAAHVVLHHSVTIAPDLVPPFDDDYAAIRQLEAIGEQRFGRGISYTRLFTPAGLIFEGHSIGRVGSHTAGYNVTGVGYCLVGNYETTEPTEVQRRAQAWCLQHDHANGWIDAPRIDFPHSAVKSTACPGQHGRAAIPTINQLAAGPTQEDDMPLSFNDLNAIWSFPCVGTDPVTGGRETWPAGIWLSRADFRAAHTLAIVREIAAAVAEGDLDPVVLGDRLEAASREAAAEGAHRAVVETVLPEIQRIRDALEQDDVSEAKAYVDELAERLRPAA